MALKIMNKNKISTESQDIEIAREKGVNSTDWLGICLFILSCIMIISTTVLVVLSFVFQDFFCILSVVIYFACLALWSHVICLYISIKRDIKEG